MKKSFKKITTSIFIFFIILLLSISIILANNVKGDMNIEINEEKIHYEIKHFDSKMICMAKLLNNEQSKINWEKLQKETYNLYNYWNSMILDLNCLNIDKTLLTDFGKELDKLSVSIKNNDKNKTLYSLIDLYDKLIIYSEVINYDNYNEILLTKYNLLVSHLVVESGNWTLVHENILEASEHMHKVINLIETDEYKLYNINQAYVAVKEMENLINIKDIDVFYIKYKIVLDKLENL